MVVDPMCEEQNWGYCRPLGVTPGVCRDSVPHWQDSDGETCGSYGEIGYCTRLGGYGQGWFKSWGTFKDFATNGCLA